MRKIGLLLGAFLVSVSCYANSVTSTSPNSEITNAIKNATQQTNSAAQNSAIAYGGQDISTHMIASAAGDQNAAG